MTLSEFNIIHSLRRPLVGIALGFIVGMLCGLHFSVAPVLLIASAGVSILIVLVFHNHGYVDLFLQIAVASVAWFSAELAIRGASAREIGALINKPGEYLSLVGIINK